MLMGDRYREATDRAGAVGRTGFGKRKMKIFLFKNGFSHCDFSQHVLYCGREIEKSYISYIQADNEEILRERNES